MKYPILTYLLAFLSSSESFAQEKGPVTVSIPYRELQLTNVQFWVGDTMIPYSILVKPTGEILVEEGFDFSYAKVGLESFHFGGKGKKKTTYKDTVLLKNHAALDLTSYFPPLNQDSTKFINAYEFEFPWSPHYNYEMYYSYLLNGISAPRLYQSNADSVVRLVIPEAAIEKEVHEVFSIDLKGSPIAISYIRIKHHYDGRFEILEEGISYVTKQKDIDLIYKELINSNFSNEDYFIKIDGALQYMVEFKTASGYFAGMRHYLDKNGRPGHSLPWTVHHLYMINKKRR